MLSGDILSQLTTLKKEIRASKDTAQGTVRGTTGRYGFVTLDDGRDAFLKPDIMDRVFHGDRVEVTVETKTTDNDKEQYEAKIEKLIHSPLKQLAGRYCIRGKGHFVVVEHQQHSRWIFIPPKARANAKDGHYVTARITQHPYETGKAQARIMGDIGNDTNIDTAKKYTLAMFQLFDSFPKEVLEQAKNLYGLPVIPNDAADNKPQDQNSRADLREQPFLTIDSAGTRDMDDALSIKTTDDGWLLSVAIADPGSEIEVNSTLDNIALRRAHTLYLPGKPVPMLPEMLSTERYSLLPEKDRLALVVKLVINTSGKVTDYTFESAVIQSKAKLSYQQVSALLNDEPYNAAPHLSDITPFKEQLLTLKQCTDTLNSYRKSHQLVTPNRDDFALLLNQSGKLESIEKIERTDAHTIVEESMIITNQCAGEFLANAQTGLFITQPGYRDERRDDITKLLSENLGEENVGDTAKLDDYIKVIRQLQNDDTYKNLFAKQQRFQQASEPSLTSAPHFGLGANYYATITSPIRRYQDLYNQRMIHKVLEKKKPANLRNKQVDKLKEAIANNRSASRLMEQWLIADYMQNKIGQTFKAYIALLTNQGIGVRLHDTGVEGFIVSIKADKNKPDAAYDKISFNNQRMELTWNDTELFLDQDVEVTLTSVDMDKKKLSFDWVNRP